MDSELKCVLCFRKCNEECKNMYSTATENSNVYDLIVKYFDPMLVVTAMNTTRQAQVLCNICWGHIDDFYEFQQTVLKAQADNMTYHQKIKSTSEKESNIQAVYTCSIKNKLRTYDQEHQEEFLPIAIEYIELLKQKKECNQINHESKQTNATIHNDNGYSEKPFINLLKKKSNKINKDGNVVFKIGKNSKRLKSLNLEKDKTKAITKSMNFKNSENATKKEAYNSVEKMREFDAFIAEHRPELECDICKVKVSNFDCLRSHFKQNHQSRCYVKCCGQQFYIRCKFVDHLRLDINPNLYKCNICSRNTSSKYALTLHKRFMHNTIKKQHECDICHRMFKQKRSLGLHMAIHATGSKDFICNECGKAYVLELQLNAHVKTVHNANFMCDQCGKIFYSACNLKQHLQVMHELRKYKCMFCDEAFKKNKDFQKHLRTHSKFKSISALPSTK